MSWAFSWAAELEEDARAQEVFAWAADILQWDIPSSSALFSSRKHLAKLLRCSPCSMLGAQHSSACVWAQKGHRSTERDKGSLHTRAGPGHQHRQSLPILWVGRTSEKRHHRPQPCGSGCPTPSLQQRRGRRGKGQGVNEHKLQTHSFLSVIEIKPEIKTMTTVAIAGQALPRGEMIQLHISQTLASS